MHIKVNIMSNKPRNDEKTIKVRNESKYQVADVKPNEVGIVSFNDYRSNTWALKRVREEEESVEEPAPIPVKEPAKKPKGTTKRILIEAFIEAAGGPVRAALLLDVDRTLLSHWLKGKSNIHKATRDIDYTTFVQLLDDLERQLFTEKVLELCQQKAQLLKSKRQRRG